MKKQPVIIENYFGIDVLRDDLLPGGSKSRFLPYLIKGAKEVVYGGPYCGGAAVCLSYFGKKYGIKTTLFYAERKEFHRNQLRAEKNGANIVQVPYGYMTNVQSKARTYCEETGALFLPLGFDVEEANKPFIEDMLEIKKNFGHYDEVWTACGSGMLTRCLATAFSESQVKAVVVGLQSRNSKQPFPDNVELISCPYKFEKDCKTKPPFNSSENYDAKAWEQLLLKGRRGKRILFWNVL
jgi:1-aminocyclopropane-1-carboxylate deaminase/D-cysteine desulfhydrase-like pyridoxal-dependent ACC family enzyme